MELESTQANHLEGDSEQPALVVLSGHSASVQGAAFSPDGRLLATAGRDGLIYLWETETGAVRRLWQRECQCYWLRFTPDGEGLVNAEDGLCFLNVKSGKWEGTLPGVCGPAAFRPDGQHLAVMDGESSVLMEHGSGQIVRRVAHGCEMFMFPPVAAVSADGGTGAATAWDPRGHRLRVWDLVTGELRLQRRVPKTFWNWERHPRTGERRKTHGAQGDVHCLALSPDGRLLAVGGTFTLWLCSTRTGRRTHLLLCGCEGVQSLAFSPDGKLLAVGTSRGKVMLWRAGSGRLLSSQQGHGSWTTAVAFSSDGKLLASGSEDKSVRTWRVDTGECTTTSFPGLEYQASGVAYSPDGGRIAVSYGDRTLRLWNARTGALERVIETGPWQVGIPLFSADSQEIQAGFQPTNPSWSVATGELLRAGPVSPDDRSTCTSSACEVLSPNGLLIASGGREGVIELRRRDTGEVIRTMTDPDEPDWVASLVFSPDGKVLAAGYLAFRVRLWEVESGKRLQLLRVHEDSISSLAFSPDGGLLAVGGDYGSVVVLCNLREETGPVRVVLSREEREDPEGTAKFWGIPPEQLPRVEEVLLEGHINAVRGVCFSSDGRTVATAGGDAALKLWNTATGELLATLMPLPSGGGAARDWITYTPDGFYHCSPGAGRFIRWRIGADLLDVEAYAKSYHSPAVVMGRLR